VIAALVLVYYKAPKTFRVKWFWLGWCNGDMPLYFELSLKKYCSSKCFIHFEEQYFLYVLFSSVRTRWCH
jgi:hypothetical protein